MPSGSAHSASDGERPRTPPPLDDRWCHGTCNENDPYVPSGVRRNSKSLHTDFRPPSAGPYVFDPKQIEQHLEKNRDVEKIKAEKIKATGHYYRLMIEHIKHVLADIRRAQRCVPCLQSATLPASAATAEVRTE